jgi:hypothetical protein
MGVAIGPNSVTGSPPVFEDCGESLLSYVMTVHSHGFDPLDGYSFLLFLSFDRYHVYYAFKSCFLHYALYIIFT